MSLHRNYFHTLPVVLFFFLTRMDATTWAKDDSNHNDIDNSFQSTGLALTDETIYEAVDLWNRGGSSKESAQILYGADMGQWNTSLVTRMEKLFQNQTEFQEDIRGWDVSRVTTLKEAFQGATRFNYDLSDWNVAQVTDFGGMFVGAASLEASICWRSIAWTAFVKNMFCGTSGASFDPCCVDEIIAMASCCGNQYCNALCKPHDVHHDVTPPAVDVDETVAFEQSMEGGGENEAQQQPSVPEDEGEEAVAGESTVDSATINNDHSENDDKGNNPTSTNAPTSGGNSNTDNENGVVPSNGDNSNTDTENVVVPSNSDNSNTENENVVEPTNVVVVIASPPSNDFPMDALKTDQETSSAHNGSSGREKGRSKGKVILGFVLTALLVSFMILIAAIFVCRRLQRTDMILDPDSTTMTGKQVPTAEEEEEEENEDEESNAGRRPDPINDTFADTEAPTLADDDVTLGTLPTLGSLPVVQQYFFFTGDTHKNLAATTENANQDFMATTESVAEETFNPLLQFTSLVSGSVAETSYTTPQKGGGEDTRKDEESGLAAIVQWIKSTTKPSP
jgi:Mycoplasma protein of unknown function, DUF285